MRVFPVLGFLTWLYLTAAYYWIEDTGFSPFSFAIYGYGMAYGLDYGGKPKKRRIQNVNFRYEAA